MFSKRIEGTGTKKTKLGFFEYWVGHCWMTGWQSIRMNFRIWADLMTNNYQNYALLKDDDPFTECYEWFWASLNEDDVYPKHFLEELLQIVDDIETGKTELIPVDENFFNEMEDLLEDM